MKFSSFNARNSIHIFLKEFCRKTDVCSVHQLLAAERHSVGHVTWWIVSRSLSHVLTWLDHCNSLLLQHPWQFHSLCDVTTDVVRCTTWRHAPWKRKTDRWTVFDQFTCHVFRLIYDRYRLIECASFFRECVFCEKSRAVKKKSLLTMGFSIRIMHSVYFFAIRRTVVVMLNYCVLLCQQTLFAMIRLSLFITA